jgi:hypothetical protein
MQNLNEATIRTGELPRLKNAREMTPSIPSTYKI